MRESTSVMLKPKKTTSVADLTENRRAHAKMNGIKVNGDDDEGMCLYLCA